MELSGTGAVVSGGASGLGAATARELASRGARVAVVDLDGDKAEALAGELGGDCMAHGADVTDESEVDAAVAAAAEAFGGLRLAVSCAGIGWAERTVKRDGPALLQPFETVVRVNLIGTFNVLRLAAAAMAGKSPGGGGGGGARGHAAPVAALPRASRPAPPSP